MGAACCLPTRTTLLLGLLLVTALAPGASPALAHGYVLRAIPADRAVLERAPARLQYWFSEALEPAFSSITVRDRSSQIIATGGVSEEDASLMVVRLPRGLPDGVYRVELRPAFASDGHVVAESRVFFVGEEVAGVAGSAAPGQALPLEVVWRALVLSSTTLLFGVFALYSSVLIPAWGSPDYRAGLLPPRVMHRLNWVVALGLAAAFAGNLLALFQQTIAFFGADAAQVLSQGLWQGVRSGSRFGEVWNARMLFLGLVAVCHAASIYFREQQPELVRAFWMGNVWLMALVIGTSSAASHAAGSLLWPWVAMAVDWLHALGVAFWAGGVGALVLVLPVALRPYAGEARRLALLAVMRRFSRLVVAAVLVVIAAGIYSALNWLYVPADLSRTTYGGALALKGLLAGLLLLVGALHHVALRPHLAVRIERLTAFTGPLHKRGIHLFYELVERAVRFAVTLHLESGLVLLVLAAAGLLSATPVPEPRFLQTAVEPLSATQTLDGLAVAMTISPGGPGVNTYDLVIQRDGQPLDGATIKLQMVNPSRDWRSEPESVENADRGLYVAAGDEIDRAGEWWSLIDIMDEGEQSARVAFDWVISAEAAVIRTREPGALNILALMGVLLAVGYAVYPTARRYLHRLDLRPQIVLVAVGVMGMTALLTLMGFAAIQRAQQDYQDTLQPPPLIVNTVLPDADSLRRGRALYTVHCQSWANSASDTSALRASASHMRDDELYEATLNGWRGLPPCSGELTVDQRWDLVNYLRTLGDN